MKVEIKNFSLFGVQNKQAECEKIIKTVEEFGLVEIEVEESSYAIQTLARLSSCVYDYKHYISINKKEPLPKYCKYKIVLDCKRESYQDEDYKLIVRVMQTEEYKKYKNENN